MQACGGSYDGKSGEVVSPGYPEDYSDDLSCTWDISVKKGSKILITFEDFAVEEDSKCLYDKLEIKERRGVMFNC